MTVTVARMNDRVVEVVQLLILSPFPPSVVGLWSALTLNKASVRKANSVGYLQAPDLIGFARLLSKPN